MMHKVVIHFGLSVLMGLLLCASTRAECPVQVFRVTLATPVSSRINRVGDPIQAILQAPLPLPQGTVLAAGTLIFGRVAEVAASARKREGQVKLLFTRFSQGFFFPFPYSLDTPDGWLHPQDADTPVWHVALDRSTRLLNQKLMRRLGPDPTVWAAALGINSSVIPDASTDEFMHAYNRHDVLMGAGDTLQLRPKCY